MGNDGSNHTGADGNQDIVAINILPAVTGRWRLQATLVPVVNLVTFTPVFLRQWATLMEVIVMRLFVLRLAVIGSTLWLCTVRITLRLAAVLVATLRWAFHWLLLMLIVMTLLWAFGKCAQAG
jgi:hypothetical protein